MSAVKIEVLLVLLFLWWFFFFSWAWLTGASKVGKMKWLWKYRKSWIITVPELFVEAFSSYLLYDHQLKAILDLSLCVHLQTKLVAHCVFWNLFGQRTETFFLWWGTCHTYSCLCHSKQDFCNMVCFKEIYKFLLEKTVSSSSFLGWSLNIIPSLLFQHFTLISSLTPCEPDSYLSFCKSRIYNSSKEKSFSYEKSW